MTPPANINPPAAAARPTTCATCGAPIEQRPGCPVRVFCKKRRCRDAWQNEQRKRQRAGAQEAATRARNAICASPPCTNQLNGRGDALYCSMRCKQRAEYHRRKVREPAKVAPSLTCAVCGGEFTPTPRARGKYCGDVCRGEATREQKRAWEAQRPKRERAAKPEGERVAAKPAEAPRGPWCEDEATAIAAFIASHGVSRIENGEWPEAGRVGLEKWGSRRQKGARA